MSPRGVNPHEMRWRQFLSETAGDEWWDREEQALVGLVRNAAAVSAREPVAQAPLITFARAGRGRARRGARAGRRRGGRGTAYEPAPARPALRQRLAAWLRRHWGLS